jgi:tetratricopeptide (TPR) repeat protein
MKRILATLLFAASFVPAVQASVEDDVRALQTEWAQIKYVAPASEQEKSFEKLTQAAAAVRDRYPTRAEPAIWYGIIAGSYAGAKGGLGALSIVKEAKKAFEDALAIDRNALDGSAYTSLGSLYYMVPGWPVGFGDDKKALEMLEAGLAVNPSGIDATYFM